MYNKCFISEKYICSGIVCAPDLLQKGITEEMEQSDHINYLRHSNGHSQSYYCLHTHIYTLFTNVTGDKK